jgi:flotillin
VFVVVKGKNQMEIISMLGSFIGLIFALVVVIFVPLIFRKVVETNMVHIVQSKKKTTSYGTGQEGGNVYYNWPSWVPIIGVTRIMLPVSNFNLGLKDYEAYDNNRVPFKVDVTAFFRIAKTSLAAQRVATVEDLKAQLTLIVQGAVRKVLASDVIDSIMIERAKFGTLFTAEVKDQLAEWGVESVKSMELMDIRDGHDSEVITNIMAKKTSHIAMESRVAVAENKQKAETAEISATREINLRQQEADQAVGERTADKDKAVGIALQKAHQLVKTEEKTTMERTMDVKNVEQVRQAEITSAAAVVAANQSRQTVTLEAEGALAATQRHSEGVRIAGEAKAAAEAALLMAPVTAQITLAREIGENAGYQQYLVTLRTVEANQVVGTAQAEALKVAEIKVIANAGDVSTGVTKAMELFSPKGGLALGGMLESLSNTPQGAAVLSMLKGKMGDSVSENTSAHLGNGTKPLSNGSAGDASVSA